ncbi:MAG: ComEC family competence protein [Thermoanaerobaculia bacterium]|nr:ComEC family competence protein [Thermoanaerobaculia bacterium]
MRQIPFLRLLLPWAAGIAAGAWINRPLPGLAYGLLAGVLLLVLLAKQRYAYRFRWVFGSLLFLLLLGAGYFSGQTHDERFQQRHFSRICPDADFFIGTVYDAPSKGARLKIPVRLEAAGPAPDSLTDCSGNILLFLEITPETERLQYGDRLWVQADIQLTQPPKNPHAFDYRQYLHYQNIHHQCFVKDRSFGVLATGLGHPLWRVAFRWRDRLLGVLREHFPGTDEYAVASALLVGYKDDLSEDLRAAYAETGSMHALAVSGTHVGLLYTGLLFLLRRVPWPARVRRWGETALVLAVIWVFTLVTGATASVLRASVMFSTYLVGKAFRRQASVWNILAASAFGLLAFNPYFLFDAGFQLSYAAVAGIVFFYPHLKKMTPTPPKWATEGWNILLMGVAAQIGTLPLSLYYFHQFPAYFWLAGWVVVLGGAVFLWGGALLAILSALTPEVAAWLGWALYGLVWTMNYLVRAIQQLPGSVISGIWIAGWAAALMYLFIGFFSGALMRYHPRLLLASLLLFAFLSICRATQNIRQSEQRQITLYHANRNFLLDCFDGQTRFSFSDSITGRQEKFAAQAHRWAHGIRHDIPVNKDTLFIAPNLYARAPFVQFYEKTLVIIDDKRWIQPSVRAPVGVEVLVLRNNVKLRLDDCLRQFPARLVVFDASNSRGRVERWKAECKSLNIPFHDVREQGAWVDEIRLSKF